MKILWENPFANNSAPLTEADIINLNTKIEEARKGNCFSLFLLPKEIKWIKDNVENGCVKSFEKQYPVSNNGLVLTIIGIDEYAVDLMFKSI